MNQPINPPAIPEMDADGYVVDPHSWTRDTAIALAARAGIGELTHEHWRVIGHLRRHFLEHQNLPPLRLVCHEVGLDDHCIAHLFGEPKTAWQVAGLPNPGEEGKAYMDVADLARE